MFTNKIKDDGFGSQYQACITSIIFSALHDAEFIYSKINLETVYEHEAENLSSLMNIENNFRCINSLTEEEKKKS